MEKDQVIGAFILAASVVGIFLYGWLIYTYPIVVLQATAFIVVAAGLVILAWIGWTLTTTPTPTPIEAMEPSMSSSFQTKAKEKSTKKAS